MISPRLLPLILISTASWGADPVIYEIRPPSSAWHKFLCPICDDFPIPQRIGGSFTLTEEESDPADSLYRLTEVRIEIASTRSYVGSGTYRLGPGDPAAEMVLDLDEGGGTTTRFSGKVHSAGFFPWPFIEIAVTHSGEYYTETFNFSAAPLTEYVECQLGPGSELTVRCPTCDLPFGSHELGGTFMAGKIAEDGASCLYRIDTMSFRTSGGKIDWEFGGYGLLSISEDNLEETAKIYLDGSDFSWWHWAGFSLSSGSGQTGAPFPRVDVTAVQEFPGVPAEFLSKLRLAASPSTAAPFHRGDPNADGTVDISDAIGTLSWLFLGSAAPKCEEAADVNADGKQDPSDAIALLTYLFQDGAPPPFPGTRWCGLPQVLTFGCDTQGNCPEWIRW